jgi:hypothetical protein
VIKAILGNKLQASAMIATGEEPVFQSWDWSNEGYFEYGQGYEDTSPRGYGLRALKVELVSCGYTDPAMKDNGQFGKNMRAVVKKFQEDHGREPDGIIGPNTSKALIMPRITAVAARMNGIKAEYLGKQASLESSFYVSCRNTTRDYSWVQMHDPLTLKHPDGSYICPKTVGRYVLSQEERWAYAYRVGVNFEFLGEWMRRMRKHLSSIAPVLATQEHIDYAMLFSWNAPAWAERWLEHDLPSVGGGDLSGWFAEYTGCATVYEWAWKYTNMVLRQPF